MRNEHTTTMIRCWIRIFFGRSCHNSH